MSKKPILQPGTRYSKDPRLQEELKNSHLRKDDATSESLPSHELTLQKYWQSPVDSLVKRDRDHNIATYVKQVWQRIQLSIQRAQEALRHRPALVLKPKPSAKVRLDDKVESYGNRYVPRSQIGISLPQLRYEIALIHRKIKDLSLKLRAIGGQKQDLKQEMVKNQNTMQGHIANTFQAELNMALSREQVNSMYIVCQQFVRTQPTILNIQTNNEYMRLGASIVTADRLRLVYERTDLQPLMQQHQVRQDGLQRQIATLIGHQQRFVSEIEHLHEQLIGHQSLAERMGATLEWVAAAEAARECMKMDSEMSVGMIR